MTIAKVRGAMIGRLWWAYLDDTGVVRVKKYTTDKAIQNCEQMPFCKGIFDPFVADNYRHAQLKIAEFLKEQERKDETIRS